MARDKELFRVTYEVEAKVDGGLKCWRGEARVLATCAETAIAKARTVAKRLEQREPSRFLAVELLSSVDA